MLRLHVVQAAFGDCLLLEHGPAAAPRFVLIDGGPPDTFDQHLKPLLLQLQQRGFALDLVVLSHVDNDHVVGLQDYFTELRLPDNDLPVPTGLWHNSFGPTLDPGNTIQPRLTALITPGRANVMVESGMVVEGIEEGVGLRTAARLLNIPLNDGIANQLITVDNVPAPVVINGLELVVVGPTQANLDELAQQWEKWLTAHEDDIRTGNVAVMANSDQSVPNLSSIMLLARAEGRTILLTGDGRSDHLLAGLAQAGLLDAQGSLHVDVLKLPHHGSNRNMTKSFFKKVKAATYVASANGKDGNPDLATLIWLVEAAQEQQRQVKLVVTNQTPSIAKLLEEYPPATYGYSLQILAAGEHEVIV